MCAGPAVAKVCCPAGEEAFVIPYEVIPVPGTPYEQLEVAVLYCVCAGSAVVCCSAGEKACVVTTKLFGMREAAAS